jgi:acyl-CoA synthetase (AMP-forming)/AMP-acid ligase II
MSALPDPWGRTSAVERIRGVPFRMYTDRPRRIEDLLRYADRWGARPYIIQDARAITYAALPGLVAGKAMLLAGLGVGRDERVMLMGWNGPEWAVNFWACLRLGAVPVLANAWWSAPNLVDALDRLQPKLLLADRTAAAKAPPGQACGPWELAPPGNAAAPLGDGAPRDEEDAAFIIFTSGSEGRPKAVVMPHRALLANLQMLLHITRRLPHQVEDATGETALHTGPLFHIGGGQTLMRALMVGDTLVMPAGRFDAGKMLALIERHAVSRWSAVPTMVARLLDHPDLAQRDVSSLRSVTLGGAPVHAELLGRIAKGLPAVEARIPTGYGLTENGGQATAASGADVAAAPGCCGKPLPLTELKLVPRPGLPDAEILVRAPTQMTGYFGTETSSIDAEGWLHTGDLGRIDENGQLWITGRSKELIIRGGENIAPAAVERALMALPCVAEAAVFGVPHPDLGEEVMAVVVAEGAPSAAALQAQLRGSLASFAVPSRWWIRVEPLPVNQTGKVDKVALKAELRERNVSAEAAAC